MKAKPEPGRAWVVNATCSTCPASEQFERVVPDLALDAARRGGWRSYDDGTACPECAEALGVA